MATFNFTFDPGTTVQQMTGFEMAGRVWSKYLTDNTTLNIHVGVTGDLASNVIGGALPGMRASQSYLDYRTALNNGPKSTDDNTALNNLSNSSSYAASFQFLDNGQTQLRVENKETLNMTRAVAKAAGISLSDGNTALDGYILFSNLANATSNGQAVRWSYDYTRSSTQANNTLDFLSTAIHELGHVLGFVSGIDQPGWLNLVQEGATSGQGYIDGMRSRLNLINPLDLFRYSQFSSTQRYMDMTYGSFGGAKSFSINQGITNIVEFATGLDTAAWGDGYQASHWKNGTNAIMNPTLSLNTRSKIAALDLQAMDVIGWDITSTGSNTTIDLSSLLTQSQQALATRANKTTTWINNNLTASPTALVANRDQMIYSMMQNSVVYDLTRITNPGSTGTISRQTLTQVFQQRSLFSTVDELDGFVAVDLSESAMTGMAYDLSSLAPLQPGVASEVVESTFNLNLTRLVPQGSGFQGLKADRPSALEPTQSLDELLTLVQITPDAVTATSSPVDTRFSCQRPFSRAYDGGMRNRQTGTQIQPAEFDNLLLLEMATL